MRSLVLALLLFGRVAFSQVTPQPLIFVSADPAGACSNGGPLRWNPLLGHMFGCVAGTWTNITGSGGSSGTVTSFSAGTLSPVFTTSVATATTTPALTFVLTNAGAGTVFGNRTGASAAPAYTATPVLGLPGTTIGTLGLAGNTSGTATITPQAAAGTPTLILPNASGTFAVSATSPLSLSATTGALTCSTCQTSATTPGSPTNSVQYNNAGAFGGAPVHAATAAELAGIDIVTNGDFSGGLTGWTVSGDGTGWSIVSGHLHHTPGQANKISTNVTVVLGDTYFQFVQVLSQSAGSANVNLGVDCNSDCGPSLIVGSNPWDLTASPDSGATVIEIQPDAASDITISSIAILHGFPSIYLPALGNSNTAHGSLVMRANTTGYSNTAFGPFVLASNTAGSFNTALGMASSLYGTGLGFSANTSVGAFSLINNSAGNSNTAVGRYSLNGSVSGSSNTFVGANSSTTKPDLDQSICIGFACEVNLDKHTVIGTSDTIETLLYGLVRQIPHTPASSSEACTAGQFAADTSFFYECVSTNLWKSTPLSTFQAAAATQVHSFGATFDGSGSALTVGTKSYVTVPYACTIQAWNATVDTGTITFDIWKIATGTAIPTVANTITASALPAISTGTAKHSTTLTAWTTTVTANDIVAVNINAVATATRASLAVQCQ